MAALIAYAAGLTTTGMEILSKALTEVFGEVSIEELGKDNLRYSVRMSMKSSTVVLVVLDSSSSEACKDIENGLYSSDKYVAYSDDKGLASFLNDKYGLDLEIPVDLEDAQVESSPSDGHIPKEEVQEICSSYEAQLADKEGIIASLQATIRGLERDLSEFGLPASNECDVALREENMLLKSQISDLTAKLGSAPAPGIHSDAEYDKLQDEFDALSSKYEALRKNYASLSQECTEAQTDGSRKSGVIRDKDAEIARLRGSVSSLSSSLEGQSKNNELLAQANATIVQLERKVAGLTTELSEKQGELDKLLSGESTTDAKSQIEDLRRQLAEKGSECSRLEEDLEKVRSDLRKALADYSSASNKNTELEGQLSQVSASLRKAHEDITLLNTTNVELSGKIRVLEQSNAPGSDIKSTLAELTKVQGELASLKGNIFNVLYTRAMPKSPAKAPLLSHVGNGFKNIRFVFSGSTESRKGTYKCLLNEIRQDTSDARYLLVDVVSETFVDYVFEINKVVNGLKWFTDGGGVQSYITKTCANNARVLSPGLGYINDSFYLTVDWEKRLQELENSGYKVILYCGDLSNIVGRVLFENFSMLGTADIYVHGNSVGSRTMLGMSRGIFNVKKATIKYFEYDPKVSWFVNQMRSQCVCEIISSINR